MYRKALSLMMSLGWFTKVVPNVIASAHSHGDLMAAPPTGAVWAAGLGTFYLLDVFLKDEHVDRSDELGRLCLHLTSSAMALTAMVLDLYVIDLRGAAVFLRAIEPETAANAGLLVMSIFQLRIFLKQQQGD